MKKNQKKPEIKLVFTGKYKEFTDFYDENKESIYRSIIELFKRFDNSNNEKKTLTLSIFAKISNLDWDTEFNFTKSESIILKRDMMPYFEKIEDYETCGEICELYKSLKGC